MSKKKPTPVPDTKISITLPGEGGLVRTGTLLVQRGDLALMSQFDYSSQAEILDAIDRATRDLVALIAAPPPEIETTEKDVYKPDLEAKKAKFVVGAQVTAGELEGEIIHIHEGQYVIDLGDDEMACLSFEELALVVQKPAETEQSTTDPLTVKGEVKQQQKSQRPATDISPVGEKTQLALF